MLRGLPREAGDPCRRTLPRDDERACRVLARDRRLNRRRSGGDRRYGHGAAERRIAAWACGGRCSMRIDDASSARSSGSSAGNDGRGSVAEQGEHTAMERDRRGDRDAVTPWGRGGGNHRSGTSESDAAARATFFGRQVSGSNDGSRNRHGPVSSRVVPVLRARAQEDDRPAARLQDRQRPALARAARRGQSRSPDRRRSRCSSTATSCSTTTTTSSRTSTKSTEPKPRANRRRVTKATRRRCGPGARRLCGGAAARRRAAAGRTSARRAPIGSRRTP